MGVASERAWQRRIGADLQSVRLDVEAGDSRQPPAGLGVNSAVGGLTVGTSDGGMKGGSTRRDDPWVGAAAARAEAAARSTGSLDGDLEFVNDVSSYGWVNADG